MLAKLRVSSKIIEVDENYFNDFINVFFCLLYILFLTNLQNL